MGLTVVGLGLLDIAIWFVVLNYFDADGLISITTTMLTFGMGASTQALFARVGGGIYTKAADVGADIVGKVEADIPEDDPRNPATIADNVGDNVGDVAGMGADLYESYCGSVLSTAALGAAAFAAVGYDIQLKAVIAPMLIAAVGVFLSLFGIFLVRTKEGATMRDLLKSLSLGTNVSAVLIAVATFAILYLLGIENWMWLSCSVITGLVAGVIIGQATEYYTSHSYKPTQKISEAGLTGSATVARCGSRVTDISIDFHRKVATDNHRFALGVMRVGRDNSTSASYFIAHIFGSNMTLDAQTLAVHILTNGHILHLRSNDASLGASYLSDRLTSLGAIINPLLTHSGQTFLQIHLIIRIGVRSAGVVDVNRSIGLHVRQTRWI